MSDYCVAVANGARARFFVLQPAQHPDVEPGPDLIELTDLANPEHELPGREVWSNLKAGRNSTPGGGQAHGYDDHRDQHEEEVDRRFVHQIVQELNKHVERHDARHVILVASKSILGLLRESIGTTIKTSVDVREIAKDLSRLSASALHERLADEELLPARKRPSLS